MQKQKECLNGDKVVIINNIQALAEMHVLKVLTNSIGHLVPAEMEV